MIVVIITSTTILYNDIQHNSDNIHIVTFNSDNMDIVTITTRRYNTCTMAIVLQLHLYIDLSFLLM